MTWFKSSSKKGSFQFPELEKKLADSRQIAKRESQKLSQKSEEILYRKEVTNKMSFIRLRNKTRKILVIGDQADDAPVVIGLLKANTNASPSFTYSLDCAVDALKSHHYDMVYIVTRIRNGGQLSGPCFFSMEEENYVRGYGHLVEKEMAEITEWVNGAEIIVVCGGDCYPMGKKKYKAGKSMTVYRSEKRAV
jgi:hypothetical protein